MGAKADFLDIQPAAAYTGYIFVNGDKFTGSGKVTGEEEFWSHTDLWDFNANVQGSQTAVASVRPILDERNPDLGKRVDERFAAVEQLLEKYRDGDGFVLYDKVTDPERKALSDAIDALSKEVSQVQGVIAHQ